MPTFESDAPTPARQPADKTDPGLASEFRPRRREQWGKVVNDDTFDPAPIPPEVKKSIDQRINELMRQTRGPDETFFALREWFTTAKRILASLPHLFIDMIRRPKEEAEDDEGEEREAEESAPASSPCRDKPQGQRRDDGQKPRQQQQSQSHRGRRGGRRHNRHGHGGRGQNQNPRGDSGS